MTQAGVLIQDPTGQTKAIPGSRKYFVLDEYSNLYYAAPSTVTLTFNYKFL